MTDYTLAHTAPAGIAQDCPRLGRVDGAMQLLAFLIWALIIFLTLSLAGLAATHLSS